MAHKNTKNYSPYKARQEQQGRNLNRPQSQLLGKHKKPESIFELNEANDRLHDVFRNHSFDLVSHQQRLQLAHFYRLLMLNQEKENFTRLLKIKDIAIKHFIDSIIITKYTNLQFPLMDIGTGPGFPGIPLKIMFPNEKIILAEGVQRRVEFLKHLRTEMKLSQLDILGRNINEYCVYPVRGVITRAVEDIGNTLKNASNCLQLGGRVYFMKGPGVDPEIEVAKKEWAEHYRFIDNIHYFLPNTQHERRLVIFEKIKHFELPEDDPESDLLLEELSSDERRRWK